MSLLNKFWSELYGESPQGSGMYEAMHLYYKSLEKQSDEYVRHIKNSLSLDTAEPLIRDCFRLVALSYSDFDSGAYRFDGFLSFDGEKLFGSKPSDLFEIEIPEDMRDPFLIVDDPVSPSVVLQRGIDFTEMDGRIVFKKDPRLSFKKVGFSDQINPEPLYNLWFLGCGRQYKTIQRLYGDPVAALVGPWSLSTKLVSLYWDMLLRGCTPSNFRRLLCVLTDTDYLDISGTVEDLYSESSRICVVVSGRLFSAPASAGYKVSVGDEVCASTFLFGNADIIEGARKVESSDFPIMHLSEGVVGADIPGGLCVVNEPAPPLKVLETVLVDEISEDLLDILVPDSDKLLFLGGYDRIEFEDEPYSIKKIIRLTEVPDFRGEPASVALFVRRLNKASLLSGEAPLNLSSEGQESYNLFDKYRSELFGANSVFIKLRRDLAPVGLDQGAALSFVDKVFRTTSSILTFLDSNSIVNYSLSKVEEVLDVFLVPDIITDTFDSASAESSVV